MLPDRTSKPLPAVRRVSKRSQRIFNIILGGFMGFMLLVMVASYFTTPTAPLLNTASPNGPKKIIKGNRASHIYHIPGCPNYDDIKEINIIWFATVDEAKAAGYRQARNC
jgi:hypothetical protein